MTNFDSVLIKPLLVMLVQIESLVLLQIVHYLLEASEEDRRQLLSALEAGELGARLSGAKEPAYGPRRLTFAERLERVEKQRDVCREATDEPEKVKTENKAASQKEALQAWADKHRAAFKDSAWEPDREEAYQQ